MVHAGMCPSHPPLNVLIVLLIAILAWLWSPLGTSSKQRGFCSPQGVASHINLGTSGELRLDVILPITVPDDRSQRIAEALVDETLTRLSNDAVGCILRAPLIL